MNLGFVLVATFQDETGGKQVGAVYGPYLTRKLARRALEESNFPSPEFVYIRRLGGAS